MRNRNILAGRIAGYFWRIVRKSWGARKLGMYRLSGEAGGTGVALWGFRAVRAAPLVVCLISLSTPPGCEPPFDFDGERAHLFSCARSSAFRCCCWAWRCCLAGWRVRVDWRAPSRKRLCDGFGRWRGGSDLTFGLWRRRGGRGCIHWWWQRGRDCCRCWGWWCFSGRGAKPQAAGFSGAIAAVFWGKDAGRRFSCTGWGAGRHY